MVIFDQNVYMFFLLDLCFEVTSLILIIGTTLSTLQQINSEKDAGCPVFKFLARTNWGVVELLELS